MIMTLLLSPLFSPSPPFNLSLASFSLLSVFFCLHLSCSLSFSPSSVLLCPHSCLGCLGMTSYSCCLGNGVNKHGPPRDPWQREKNGTFIRSISERGPTAPQPHSAHRAQISQQWRMFREGYSVQGLSVLFLHSEGPSVSCA